MMRHIFLSASVPSGEAWKEWFWGLVITMLANMLGYITTEVIHRVGSMSYADASGRASWTCIVFTTGLFRFVGFTLFAAFTLALGVGLIIFAPHQESIWASLLDWAFGYILIVRAFSEGPVMRKDS